MAGRIHRAARAVATGTRIRASITPPGPVSAKNAIVLQPIMSYAVQAEKTAAGTAVSCPYRKLNPVGEQRRTG